MSNVKISTKTLQDLLNRFSKLGSPKDMQSYGGLIQIRVSENTLYLTSLGATSALCLSVQNIDCDDFQAVVDRTFTSLVNKTTSEYITLTREGNNLLVEGNGKYRYACKLDPDGKTEIFFPTIEFDYNVPKKHLTIQEIKTIVASNKGCLAKEGTVQSEATCYLNYYTDKDITISCDGSVFCLTPISATDTPTLLRPEFVENLLSVADSQGVDIFFNGENVFAVSGWGVLSDTIDIYSDVNDYNADRIKELFEQDMEYNAVVPKNMLLKAIDRTDLFSGAFGTKHLKVKLDNTGITIYVMTSGRNGEASAEVCQEFTPYINKIEKEYEKVEFLDMNYFKYIINACTTDTVDFGFNENSIKVCSGNIKYLQAFLDDSQKVEVVDVQDDLILIEE